MTSVAQTYRQEREFSTHALMMTFLQIIGSSLLIALCSQIKIILPFTPIPLTLQTFAILLIGASLGSRKGACAVLCYFAQIAAGLPVLSGGDANPLVFFGPKGGYVLGFFVQAFIMGWFAERANRLSSFTFFAGALSACTVQMAMGVFVLAQFVGWQLVWTMGLYPFIPGEIFKAFTAVFILTYPKIMNYNKNFKSLLTIINIT